MFSREQKELIKKTVPQVDPEHLTNEDLMLVEEKVGDLYNQYCLDNAPEDQISQCEKILDLLA